MSARPPFRRLLLLSALASALVPSAARAAGPAITAETLQCDGTYQPGTFSNHPSPVLRSVETSSGGGGLKLGQRRVPQPSSTAAMWRFDGVYNVTQGACFTGSGCPGGDSCRTWTYQFVDPETGAPTLKTGSCTYRDSLGVSCANTMAIDNLFFTNQSPVGVGACPASTATLPGTGTFANVIVGPRPGTAANHLSAQAISFNSANSMYATTPNSSTWNLGPTYTLGAWVNAGVSGGRIISQQSGGNYWGIGISTGGSTGLRHFDSRDAGSNPDFSMGSGLVSTGWHLVHVVRNSATASRRYYIDGRFIGQTVAASTDSFSGHPIGAPVYIGSYQGVLEFFNGQIDDVHVLNAALSDDEIMAQYDSQVHWYSPDSVSFSTFAGSYVGSPTEGTTSPVEYAPGEAWSSNGRWKFLAQSVNGDTTLSATFAVTRDVGGPVPGTLAGTPTTTNDVTWTWGAPTKVCPPPGSGSVNYDLLDASNNAVAVGPIAYPGVSTSENYPGAPNQIVSRRIRLTDTWGTGLGLPTTVYTLSNPAAASSLVATAVTTGSVSLTWGTNSNPSYTRWLFAYSPSPTFATSVSTPITLATGYTGNTVSVFGLNPGSTYYFRVQSFNGRSSDIFGGVPNNTFVSASVVTYPAAPTLTGAPQTTSSILWSWTSVPGAQYYNLYDGSNALIYTGPALSAPQGGLAVNTQYSASVEAVSLNGAGPRGNGSSFTNANDPTSPSVTGAFSSSITYSWNANGNPGYTFYEVSVTTDSSFNVIVTTLTVNTTSATATGLFPSTSYYARVRSVDGSQTPGNFLVIASTFTRPDPNISVNTTPASIYSPYAGVVGQWQFDESTGTSSSDGSGLGNTARLGCSALACVSTPTWAAGPAGLGSAVSFSGLNNGLVRVTDTPTFAYTGSLTLEAWANPSTLSQPSGAGLIVRGDGGAENFALDVSAGLWRFTPRPGTNVTSTNTIAVGQWTHILASYDAALASATIYINGRPASTALAVPARLAASHDISIGNRQSGTGAYDRGFIGRLDGVRVVHKALTPAEALAEYQGSFISTITANPPNSAVTIGLPPNAFGASATVLVTMDPIAHGISVTPSVINNGLAAGPTGYVRVPNSLFEIVPLVGGVPFTDPLGSSATISVPYTDANDDNVLDGTNPPLAASALRMFTLNTIVNRWEALPTYVDRASRRVIAWTPHFSVFSLFAPATIGQSLAQIRLYPVPWTPGSGDRFDATGVTFDRLPVAGTIRIITLSGEKVRDLRFDGLTAGTLVWDGLNDSGRRAASGVYFARIEASDGPKTMLKFAIER